LSSCGREDVLRAGRTAEHFIDLAHWDTRIRTYRNQPPAGRRRSIGIALASALGGLAVLTALIWLSRRVSTATLLVAGLMLGYLCTGPVSVILHLVDETQAQTFQTWNDGSFAGATRQQLRVAIPLLAAGLVYAAAQVKTLNVLMLGERYASSLGLRVERARSTECGWPAS
jgi:iron complex transport system permease protein